MESITCYNLYDFENAAGKILDDNANGYYQSGAWDGKTLKANREDFDHYQFLPKILRDVSNRDSTISLFNNSFSMPVGIAPTAFHQLANDEGEIATAKAALRHNVPFILSTLSNRSIEEVGTIFNDCDNRPWFQLYVHKDRELTRNLIQRAEASGFAALVVTVDAPFLGDRDIDRRNHFTLPNEILPINVKQSLPNNIAGSALMRYFTEQIDPSLTFETLEWLAHQTKLPIIAKGVLRVDDIHRCLQHGAKAIIVSNHGGRQLDCSISTISALQIIKDNLNNQVEIFFDGGIRRGTDILKALAIGAKAVFIGRPILWGLACGGQNGVEQVLTILKNELDLAMALCGCPTLKDITQDLLIKINNG